MNFKKIEASKTNDSLLLNPFNREMKNTLSTNSLGFGMNRIQTRNSKGSNQGFNDLAGANIQWGFKDQ